MLELLSRRDGLSLFSPLFYTMLRDATQAVTAYFGDVSCPIRSLNAAEGLAGAACRSSRCPDTCSPN